MSDEQILIVLRDDSGHPFSPPRALVGDRLVTLVEHPNGWLVPEIGETL